MPPAGFDTSTPEQRDFDRRHDLTLSAALSDGKLTADEISRVHFTDDEVKAILAGASSQQELRKNHWIVTPETLSERGKQVARERYPNLPDETAFSKYISDVNKERLSERPFWKTEGDFRYYTAQSLPESQRRIADDKFKDVPVEKRYALQAYIYNQTRAAGILTLRLPEFQAYVELTYDLWRMVNPIHFVGEKSVVIASGKEYVLQKEASRAGAAIDLLLYFVIVRGTNWVLGTAKFGVGEVAAVEPNLIRFKSGGTLEVTPASKNTYSIETIENGIERAVVGEQIVLVPNGTGGAAVTAKTPVGTTHPGLRATPEIPRFAKNGEYFVSPDGTPLHPIGTGRMLSIYGEREAIGFQDVATEARFANGRPLTTEIAARSASDIALRDAPLSMATLAEIQRLAKPNARVTYSAAVDGFDAQAQKLLNRFRDAKVLYRGNVTSADGVERSVLVIEIP